MVVALAAEVGSVFCWVVFNTYIVFPKIVVSKKRAYCVLQYNTSNSFYAYNILYTKGVQQTLECLEPIHYFMIG